MIKALFIALNLVAGSSLRTPEPMEFAWPAKMADQASSPSLPFGMGEKRCHQSSPPTKIQAPASGVLSLRASADQTNTTAAVTAVAGAVRDEEIRAACVQGRRIICGRILEVRPEGLLVESGYPDLLRAPLNQTWLVPGTVTATRDASLVESDRPDAICAGRIWLTGLPKSRTLKPKIYDYVNLHAYPAGHYTEVLPGNQQRTIRRFAAGLETAIRLNRGSGDGSATGAAPASK